jgi:hypothetical protein
MKSPLQSSFIQPAILEIVGKEKASAKPGFFFLPLTLLERRIYL